MRAENLRPEVRGQLDKRLKDQKTAESARQVAAATNGPRDEETKRSKKVKGGEVGRLAAVC